MVNLFILFMLVLSFIKAVLLFNEVVMTIINPCMT